MVGHSENALEGPDIPGEYRLGYLDAIPPKRRYGPRALEVALGEIRTGQGWHRDLLEGVSDQSCADLYGLLHR